MPLTKRQLSRRSKYLGASELASIIGLNPYSTAYNVWAEKTGKLIPAPSSAAANAGNRFEPGVREWCSEGDDYHIGLGKITTRNLERRIEGTPILIHLDAIVESSNEPLEIKTTGLFGPVYGDWGEGPEDIPVHFVPQVTAAAAAMGSGQCHLGVCIGGRGFRRYCVTLDVELWLSMVEAANEFWEYVLTDTEPPDSEPTEDVIKRMKREKGKSVTVSWEPMVSYAFARQKRIDYEKEEEQWKGVIAAEMGDAEIAEGGTAGKLAFTPVKQSRIDVTRLKAEQPDIAKEYTKVVESRRSTYTPSKNGDTKP